MLKKLLKYDFKSVFKYWWIAAVSATALSVLGGFCLKILVDSTAEETVFQPPEVLTISSSLLLMLTVMAISAFSVISAILLFVRFYKNFFTDEAYLTFTLPVKRSTHLNSKLILGFVTQLATSAVIILDAALIIVIGLADKIFKKEVWEEFILLAKEFFKEVDGYFWVFLLETLFIMLIISIAGLLFTYACITFASMITKKAKLITAIGIYYGATSVVSFVFSMIYLFGVDTIITFLDKLPENSANLIIVLIALVVLLFVAMICTLLYTFEQWMLDRKLNLA
jgi:hypothetical protein